MIDYKGRKMVLLAYCIEFIKVTDITSILYLIFML